MNELDDLLGKLREHFAGDKSVDVNATEIHFGCEKCGKETDLTKVTPVKGGVTICALCPHCNHHMHDVRFSHELLQLAAKAQQSSKRTEQIPYEVNSDLGKWIRNVYDPARKDSKSPLKSKGVFTDDAILATFKGDSAKAVEQWTAHIKYLTTKLPGPPMADGHKSVGEMIRAGYIGIYEHPEPLQTETFKAETKPFIGPKAPVLEPRDSKLPYPHNVCMFLKALYAAASVMTRDEKIVFIRKIYGLQGATITGGGDELEALEFYVVTKLGLV